jgi:hypothetical protein
MGKGADSWSAPCSEDACAYYDEVLGDKIHPLNPRIVTNRRP